MTFKQQVQEPNKLFEEKKLNIRMIYGRIKKGSEIKIQPAFGGTYLVHYKYKDQLWGLRHIRANGIMMGELKGQRKFQYKMISEDQVIVIQKKYNDVKISTWNLRNYNMTVYLHQQTFNQQYTNFYVFPKTKLICMEGNLQVKQSEKQSYNLKVLTYYQHPLTEESSPVNSYSFKMQNKDHNYPFQINNSSRLIIFNFLLDQHRNAAGSEYRVCDQNGFRIIACPRITIDQSIYYFPREIIQMQNNTLFVRYSFQNKNLLFKQADISPFINKPTCPENIFRKLGCYQENYLYQTLWNYQKYNQFSCPDFLNKSKNMFFVKRIPNDSQYFINRDKMLARVDFVGPKWCRYDLVETIQEKQLYQRFNFSNYDPNTFYFYQFKQNEKMIEFNIRVIKINSIELQKCLNDGPQDMTQEYLQ